MELPIVLVVSLLMNIWLLFFECRSKSRSRRFYIHFFVRGRRVRKEMQLKVNDQLPLTIQAADEFGNPTQSGFDAAPTWSQSDPSVATILVSADGLSCSVTSTSGKLASATIQVSGLVGGKAVLGSLQIDFVAGDVAEISIQPGTPVAVSLPSST